MQQVILEEPGRFRLDEVDPPRGAGDDALVRVHRVGVCGTDIHAFAGTQSFLTYPRVLGHELGVEVEEIGPNDAGIKAGDQCCIEPYLFCGDCLPCRNGKTNCCESLTVLGVQIDGAMGELFSIPVRYLYRSTELTLDQLALIETLSIGDHGVLRSGLSAGERALVVGAGPIGIGATQFALATGADVTLLEIDEHRRDFARDALSVNAVSETEGATYDVVIDATGSKPAMEASFGHVAHGGRLVFISHFMGNIEYSHPDLMVREMSVIASRNSAGRFPEIIRMVEAGEIDTAPWITHRMSLADVPAQFKQIVESRDCVKAMIDVISDQ